MENSEITQYIANIPDDVLTHIAMSSPWQYDPDTNAYRDPDGITGLGTSDKDDSSLSRAVLQENCWLKAQRNPHINTTVKRFAGRLTGHGFEITSDIQQIASAVKEIEYDQRNRLYTYYYKWVIRAMIEGELFLCLTCHKDGSIEVDFIDPVCVQGTFDDTGILFHPTKTTMPLLYNIKYDSTNTDEKLYDEQIPSIFMAMYPDELWSVARKCHGYSETLLDNSRDGSFKKLGGFKRFIVSWDRSWLTKRNVGHIRAILEWVNLYENLKKWEADYKKACSAYVWAFEMEDKAAFRLWLQMSDADRKKTGMAAKKVPGASLIIPPGIKSKVLNPTLPSISDEDRDILMMINAGLDAPEDETTGESRGTFASVKASRPPMVEKTSDEVEYWHKFLRYDLWGNIFFLKEKISSFKNSYFVNEVVGFDDKKKPIKKRIKKSAADLLLITSPISEIGDLESKVKALFGVKHASLKDIAGLPIEELVKRIGFNNYRKLRLDAETEKLNYPELLSVLEAESFQEGQLENKTNPKKGTQDVHTNGQET